MLRSYGGVQHVGLYRRAVALDHTDLPLSSQTHFGSFEMVVQARKRRAVNARVPDDAAVGLDERDASVYSLREAVGLGVYRKAHDCRILREELCDEERLVTEPAFDEQPLFGAQLPCDESGCQNQRRCRDAERGREDLGAEPETHGSSLSTSL